MVQCPGQDNRRLTVCEVPCPGCGKNVEMFSDEHRRRCPHCGAQVTKPKLPNCARWCKAARDCLGHAAHQALIDEDRETGQD